MPKVSLDPKKFCMQNVDIYINYVKVSHVPNNKRQSCCYVLIISCIFLSWNFFQILISNLTLSVHESFAEKCKISGAKTIHVTWTWNVVICKATGLHLPSHHLCKPIVVEKFTKANVATQEDLFHQQIFEFWNIFSSFDDERWFLVNVWAKFLCNFREVFVITDHMI